MEPGVAKEVFEVKLPGKIKKGLENCANGNCRDCDYEVECMVTNGGGKTQSMLDALGYIRQLEELASSRLRRMKLFRERANTYIKECVQFRNRVKKLEEQIADTGKMEPVILRTDDLGRVAIPKEYRERLGIREGDALEIEVDGPSGAIVMRKVVDNE